MRGNPLPPHGLLFPISSKGSFICTITQTGYQIPWQLLHQLWTTGWNSYFRSQDNTIYKLSINISFLNIGQDKSKLQKQISKLLILTATYSITICYSRFRDTTSQSMWDLVLTTLLAVLYFPAICIMAYGPTDRMTHTTAFVTPVTSTELLGVLMNNS